MNKLIKKNQLQTIITLSRTISEQPNYIRSVNHGISILLSVSFCSNQNMCVSQLSLRIQCRKTNSKNYRVVEKEFIHFLFFYFVNLFIKALIIFASIAMNKDKLANKLKFVDYGYKLQRPMKQKSKK